MAQELVLRPQSVRLRPRPKRPNPGRDLGRVPRLHGRAAGSNARSRRGDVRRPPPPDHRVSAARDRHLPLSHALVWQVVAAPGYYGPPRTNAHHDECPAWRGGRADHVDSSAAAKPGLSRVRPANPCRFQVLQPVWDGQYGALHPLRPRKSCWISLVWAVGSPGPRPLSSQPPRRRRPPRR